MRRSNASASSKEQDEIKDRVNTKAMASNASQPTDKQGTTEIVVDSMKASKDFLSKKSSSIHTIRQKQPSGRDSATLKSFQKYINVGSGGGDAMSPLLKYTNIEGSSGPSSFMMAHA